MPICIIYSYISFAGKDLLEEKLSLKNYITTEEVFQNGIMVMNTER